jgi:hypothetical protein
MEGFKKTCSHIFKKTKKLNVNVNEIFSLEKTFHFSLLVLD